MIEFDYSNNLLTTINGANLTEYSSCRPRCDPQSLLSSDKGVWVSSEGLPQYLTIDLSGLSYHPNINFFGWYCWHSYSSNPSVIELQISSDGKTYKKWATFQGQLSTKPQIFSIDTLTPSTNSIKIVIKETFGASNCYLNKLYLLEKLQKHKIRKNNDESIVNTSEISNNSHEVQHLPMFEKNFKSKLKFQLEELEESVNVLKEKYDKPDEMMELRSEVQDCQDRMVEISENLKILIEKVGIVEKKASGLSNSHKIGSVKDEILKEIRNKKKKRQKEKSQKFNRVTDRFNESRASDILALIQLKTQEKMEKIKELEREKEKLMKF